MPKTYRLGSSALVHAPGVVRFAIKGYRWPKDRPVMVAAVASWGVPEEAVHALLSEQIPYTVEGATVVFTFPATEGAPDA